MSSFDSDSFDTAAFDSASFDFDTPVSPLYRTFAEWIFNQPGLTGSTNDRLSQYLRALGYKGHNSDMMFEWLGSLGYLQKTLPERAYAWSLDNLLI